LGHLVAAAFAAIAFWPQAGVLGQDLYHANSVDLDPAAGATLDPWCGHRTYDTHSGVDVTIRSFREVRIGVPVFSATDGTIAEVQDGMYDFRFGPTVSTFDNHVTVRATDGRYFVYGHFRHGITWKRGQTVRAGQQLGWVASSGSSSWPHLHFTELAADAPRDPFAGPCRAGEPDFVDGARPFRDAAYARAVVVSAKSFTGNAQLPWDEARRTGTFVAGTRDVYVRVELGEYAGGSSRLQVVRPDGSVAFDDPDPVETPDGIGQGHGQAAFDLHARVRFDRVGAWHLRYVLDGATLVDAPLRVVARAAQARNRPPDRIGVTLTRRGALAECRVETPALAVRDPDYDLVRNRYRWTLGAQVLRTVTSTALTDQARADAPGRLRCLVTPSDGRLAGRTASAG
jgi:hypothetical protein